MDEEQRDVVKNGGSDKKTKEQHEVVRETKIEEGGSYRAPCGAAEDSVRSHSRGDYCEVAHMGG